MKVLITGAGGFIGRKLSAYLTDKHAVFNLVSKKRKNLNIKNKIAVDLADCRQAQNYFKNFRNEHQIDIIIHLASRLAAVDKIDDVDILYYNLKITESLVNAAKLLKPKKIINFSSISVYPNKDGSYSELSGAEPFANPDCLYGLSKFCGENLLNFLLRKQKLKILHLRVANVYGEGMRTDRLIPAMLKELRENNSITVFGMGKRVSNFIEINSLVKIVESFLGAEKEGIYNVGGKNISYFELAQNLIKRYGNKESKIIKDKKGASPRFFLDTAKLESVLNRG